MKLKGLEEGEHTRAGAYYQVYAQDPSRRVAWAIRGGTDVASTRASVERALAEIIPKCR